MCPKVMFTNHQMEDNLETHMEEVPERNLPGGPPFKPPIGFYGWPAPDPHMFIPPWYQPLVV